MAFDHNIAIGASLRSQLLAIDRTARSLDISSGRLATGKKVNSAIENAPSFFAARELQNTAADYQRLTDRMGQNIQVIKEASSGLSGIQKLLQLAETLGIEALESIGGSSSTFGLPLPQLIQAENPGAYWQLDNVNFATNQGTIGGVNGNPGANVSFGQPPLYPNGGSSARFDGSANSIITIPDSNQINTSPRAERTIEMVFQADDTTGRQVLYEEGATVNSLGIYIDNGNIHIEGRDNGDWGPFGINAPIVAGETYHVSLVLDQPNNEFRAYLDGELLGIGFVNVPLASHSGDIAIGGTQDGLVYHDGPDGSSGRRFRGSISDVALYNTVLDEAIIQQHASATEDPTIAGFQNDFDVLMDQITQMARDSSFRGTNLLFNDSLVSVFNPDESSQYTTAGSDFTAEGLSLDNLSFSSASQIRTTLDAIRSAIGKVRSFEHSLATDLNVIQNRINFTQSFTNNQLEGADKLTLADLNEESAKVLTAQTQQAIQFSNLSSAVRGRDLANLLFNS